MTNLQTSITESIKNIDEIISTLGTTNNIMEAGYILINGNFLDLSGKNNGGPEGHRNEDHYIINQFLEYNSNFEGLTAFINDGNIRISPEYGGIYLNKKPNLLQEKALIKYIDYFKGEILLDITSINGMVIHSREYKKGTNYKIILQDIYKLTTL